MEKLGEAIIKLVEAGAPVAGDAVHWYFIVRLVSEIISYTVPAVAFVTIALIITRTIRALVGRAQDLEDKRLEGYRR